MFKSSTFLELRLLVVAGLAMSGLSYATNLFLANSMGSEKFGQYTYALVLGSLFGELVFFGSAETGMRLKANYGERALDWIFTAKIFNFILASIACIVSYFVMQETAILYALVVTLNSLSFATQYEANGLNVRYSFVYLVERVFITLFIWIGLFFIDNQIMAWVFGTMAMFQGASLIFQYNENRATRITFNWRGLSKVYSQGLFILVFSLAKFSFGGVTRILIFNELGKERMGVFSAAWQFVPLSTLYFAQTTKTWRLRITRSLDEGNTDEFRESVASLSFFVMVPSMLAAIIFWLFGKSIIGLLLSSEYQDAGALIPYIGAYFLVIGFDSVVVLLAIASSRAMLAGMIYLVFGGLTILACLLLSKDHDLEGYLLTILLGHFCAATALGLALSRSIWRSLR
jgi:O-antigen/teichoic acid export membrane protein